MDNKKNNMKQAMYEMFGVGSAPAEAPTPTPTPTVQKQPVAAPETRPAAPAAKPAAPQPVRQKAPASYLAPGTVMEGTLRSAGDVEIAGDFKGDITTEGTVVLHSSIQGNLSVHSLNLSGCTLVGDVVAKDSVTVSEDSEVRGNITAREIHCAGRITGDLKIAEHTVLEGSAQINGGIISGSLAVARGALIKGSIEIQSAKASH